ncbi:hypothetical protein VP14_159 [Vibrio phage VPMCC14]|nr:hypothetical protein VP14_159 [Vibrio phage VPMCC14]
MNNKETKLFNQYRKVIENLPDYNGDFDDPEKKDYYLRGFEEWKRLQKEFSYYNYQSCAISYPKW